MVRSSAAEARRRAAHEAGDRGGDAAYERCRRSVSEVGPRRSPVPAGGCELRTQQSERNGKPVIHTSGYFTRYERGYPMWDKHGEYVEMTMRGSGTRTLAAAPDVAFLVNHKGVAMARTRARGRDATLVLREDETGGFHEAWLNPDRGDVRDLVAAIDDGIVTEMSFAFTIPEGGGLWSDDFEVYQILAYDLDRGDVSAVNYGANPFTDISARSGEILAELEHLPEGARDEAARRLGVADIEQRIEARERIEVTPRGVDTSASPHVRRLQWRVANTAARMATLAAETGMAIGELADARLPWFEIREAEPQPVYEDGQVDPQRFEPGDTTEVLIYDEIGGSFGVTAKTFAAAIAQIETPNISLRINSPGGSVFDALAIANSLRHHPARVTAYVDGYAASAASIIAIAADETVAMPGAEFMIHRASIDANGNVDDMRQLGLFLAKQDANIAQQYADKAGGDPSEWLAMMEAETWYLPQEALDAGLVDRVYSTGTRKRGERICDDPRMVKRWDMSHCRYAGRDAAPVTQQRRAGARTIDDEAGAFLQGVVEAYESDRAPMPVPDDPERVAITNGSIGAAPSGRRIATIEALIMADGGDLG